MQRREDASFAPGVANWVTRLPRKSSSVEKFELERAAEDSSI